MNGRLTFEHTFKRHMKVKAGSFTKDCREFCKQHFAEVFDHATKNVLDDEIMALDHHSLHLVFSKCGNCRGFGCDEASSR